MVYERHYVGSLPCMPARRDLLTGRLTFLHRSWGPLEPFDNAFPELLKANGIHSHLATDHYHYWEDGGATYHTRYSTYDFIRGQECDVWKAMVQPPWERLREKYGERMLSVEYMPHLINREFIREEKDFPSVQCFARGFDFLDVNRSADNWFLQIETFDPHEPFFAPDRFKEPFKTGWNGPIRDWPRYGRVEEIPAEAAELRANYYATVALCDYLLGQLLDYFDRYELWLDTALIVTTDHGFLLGEHDFWAKNRMHMYEEIVHIPLLVHVPNVQNVGRTRRLTQSIDIAPTLLDLYGIDSLPEIQGKSLMRASSHEGLIFGYFGGAVNVTDGRYTYHRFPKDIAGQEIYQYTLMPTHLAQRFTTEELSAATLVEPFSWTKKVPVLKIPVIKRSPMYSDYGPGCLLETDTRLYDLETDPGQDHPLQNREIEADMANMMWDLMTSTDAPAEAFSRLDLAVPVR
jgi:arylsulfatase A-like enzyme